MNFQTIVDVELLEIVLQKSFSANSSEFACLACHDVVLRTTKYFKTVVLKVDKKISVHSLVLNERHVQKEEYGTLELCIDLKESGHICTDLSYSVHKIIK